MKCITMADGTTSAFSWERVERWEDQARLRVNPLSQLRIPMDTCWSILIDHTLATCMSRQGGLIVTWTESTTSLDKRRLIVKRDEKALGLNRFVDSLMVWEISHVLKSRGSGSSFGLDKGDAGIHQSVTPGDKAPKPASIPPLNLQHGPTVAGTRDEFRQS